MKKNLTLDKSSEQKKTESAILAEPVVLQEQFSLNWFDYIAAPVIALLIGIWVFPYVGTSINWDELVYMNLSNYTTPQAWVMNRYGHVYLQKICFWLSRDAFLGTRIYWSVQIFVTAVLVYWCARMLAGKRGYIPGIIAVVFFSMQTVFVRWLGSTFPDYTVMMLITFAVFIYLRFIVDRFSHRHLFIILLGLIFFWAVKSKETGICLAVLFLGLGAERTGRRTLQRFVKDFGWACVGVIIGCILLMMLDLIFMGDFLFSVSPSNIREMLSFNFEPLSHSRPSMTWYTFLSAEPIFAPCILCILMIGSIKNQPNRWGKTVIWIMPLVVMLFLRFSYIIQGRYYITGRYFTPALPIVCIWAAQFFQFDLKGRLSFGKNNSGIPRIIVAVIFAVVAFLITWAFMAYIQANTGIFKIKDPHEFYLYAIMTMSTTLFLIVIAIFKNKNLFVLFVSYLYLFLIIFSPLKYNIQSLRNQYVKNKSIIRYEPYRYFAGHLRFDKDVKILVSKESHKRTWFIGRDQRGHWEMFNIFFNEKLDYDQFIDGTTEDILKGQYTFAFITLQQWKNISKIHDVEHLKNNFEFKLDKRTGIVLLKKITPVIMIK